MHPVYHAAATLDNSPRKCVDACASGGRAAARDRRGLYADGGRRGTFKANSSTLKQIKLLLLLLLLLVLRYNTPIVHRAPPCAVQMGVRQRFSVQLALHVGGDFSPRADNAV